MERGIFGLDRVYKQNNKPIQDRFKHYGLYDIREYFVSLLPPSELIAHSEWLGPAVTYGQLLAITRPEFPRAALTFAETEIVVLTCLMARHAHREVLWHLRGCLRAGMTADEVEGCQKAIELCLAALQETKESTTVPMPRVCDVTETDILP